MTPDLRLLLLKFRFPPLSCLLEGPIKLFRSVPVHIDSALAAAELFLDHIKRGLDPQVFIVEMFLRASRGQIEIDAPRCLKWVEGDLRYPRASALLPIRSLKENALTLLIPSEKPYLVELTLEESTAKPIRIKEMYAEILIEYHNILPLRKRTNIERLLQLLTAERIDLVSQGLGQIEEGRGPYRAIDSRARLEGVFSNTAFAAILEVTDEDLLRECLELLCKMGVGKKRDMGYGDLRSYRLYRLIEGQNELKLQPEYLEWRERELTHRVTLRLLPWRELSSWMECGWRLISVSTVLCSPRPPYWADRRVSALPFGELARVSG